MPLSTDLIGVGIVPSHAEMLGYSNLTPITASGTTSVNAFVIKSQVTQIEVTASVGNTAMRLPSDAEFQQDYLVFNSSAVTAVIFPPTGSNINGQTVDTAVSVGTNVTAIFSRLDRSRWISQDNFSQPSGIVNSIAIATANGFSGSSSGGTTPTLTLSATPVGTIYGDGVSLTGLAGTASTVLHGNVSGPPTFGQVALASEVSGQLATANGGEANVATRSAMAGLDTAKSTVAYLSESGRQGWFQWDSSNLSTKVTSDPNQGIYVAPTSAPTGTSGAWVRVYNRGHVESTWFGVSTANANNASYLQAAINFVSTESVAGEVHTPASYPSEFVFRSGVTLKNYIVLTGDSSATAGAEVGTIFNFVMPNGGGVCIDSSGFSYPRLRNLLVLSQNALFTGTILRLSAAATPNICSNPIMSDCTILDLNNSTTLVDLSHAIEGFLDNNSLIGGAVQVQLSLVGASTQSTTHTFNHNSHVGGVKTYVGGGEGMVWSNEIFEGTSAGTAHAHECTTSNPLVGSTWTSNWYGDVTVAGGKWHSGCYLGLTVESESVGSSFSADVGWSLLSSIGFDIAANSANSITLVDFADSSSDFGEVRSTRCVAGGISISNLSSAGKNVIAYGNSDGIGTQTIAAAGSMVLPGGAIKKWGVATVTSGTPLTVTFPAAFRTACYGVQITLASPTAGTNTLYLTGAPSTASFQANVVGSAGTNSVYWEAIGS